MTIEMLDVLFYTASAAMIAGGLVLIADAALEWASDQLDRMLP